MDELTILLATFASVLIISALVLNYFSVRREMQVRLGRAETPVDEAVSLPADFRGLPIDETELLKHYFSVVRSDKDPNSLQNRLIRAGYFSPEGVRNFQILRVLVALAAFAMVVFGVSYFFPGLSRSTLLVAGLFVSGFMFFICSIVLERKGDKREVSYRRLFPDFMDTLIVCLDAGMSVEAAIDRV